MKKESGLTLIEILVVISISSFIVVNLLGSFLKSRINISEVQRIMVSDIRRAQADSLSAKQFNGLYRCGYGLHMLTSSQASPDEPFGQTYYLFTTKNSPPSCGNLSYQPSDSDVVVSRVLDSRLELCGPPLGSSNCGQSGNFPRFEDIFFESPYAIPYIKNKTCPIGTPSQAYSQILIRKKGAVCPSSNCTYICVFASGKIQSQASPCIGQTC